MTTLAEEAFKTVVHSPMLLYQGPLEHPLPGFLVSNESNHFSLKVPKGGGQCLLGFGTTVNWDIAFRRKVRFLILVEQSTDVLLTHFSVFRPLFLISETPEEFLCNLCGFEGNGALGLEPIFDRIAAGEGPSASVLERLQGKMMEVLTDPNWAVFGIEVIQAGASGKGLSPFRTLRMEQGLGQLFRNLYDVRVVSALTKRPKLLLWPKSFSFLASPKNYRQVRELYLNDRVRFAFADIRDGRLYQKARAFLQLEDLALTDLYLANLPSRLAEMNEWTEKEVLALWRPLASNDHTTYVYESKGVGFPYRYKTQVLRPE